MAIKLNSKGNNHAKSLIASGKVDKSSGWSFSADDGNELLGDDNWGEYGKWFLAVDDAAEVETKGYYKYPFGKSGSVYRSALVAIRQRAGQQGAQSVFDAAGTLLEKIDGKEKEKDAFCGPNIERRTFQVGELRVIEKDGSAMIEGHAAVFNKLSEDLGGWQEKIMPGAFRQAIKDSDVRALFNHDPNFVLGRKSNNTLNIKEDKEGLWMQVSMPDTQLIRDLVLAPIRRGDVKEQSFGFIVQEDEWTGLDEDERKKKPPVRTIRKVARLFDVSPVTFPAYPDTDVAVRSMNRAIEKIEKRGGFDIVKNPVEEILLNTLANLEEFKKIFAEKTEDEAREHFKQVVMNFVAFISPEVEFDSYDELIIKEQAAVIEPMQDPPVEPDLENRTSIEPTQDGDSNDDNGGEPMQPLIDPDKEQVNPITILLRRFQDAPIEVN